MKNIRFLFSVSVILISLGSTVSIAANKDEEGWILRCDDYNGDYTGAPVASGTIGILPWKEPFSIRHVILNHIFEYSDEAGVNKVMQGINPFNLTMTVDGDLIDGKDITSWQQWIDMRNASHNTSFIANGKVKVEYSVVALRNMPYAAVVNVHLTALKDVGIYFTTGMKVPEKEYQSPQFLFQPFNRGGQKDGILQTIAKTSHGRYEVSAASSFIFQEGKFDYNCSDNQTAQAGIRLLSGQKAVFSLVGTICTTHDFSDPFSESKREIIYIHHQNVDSVLAVHKKCWDELWKGDIEIRGDVEAQHVVRFALFNLYSFCRQGTDLSISPMGLSSQGYNGHIFWDAETWMFPPMLLMNEGIAQSMISYRTGRLKAAQRRAASYGYAGAMFPWESDDFGEEATPIFAITGQFEHHISADIAIACWNYYCVSHDKKWLTEKGWPLIREVAEFWASRVRKNTDGSFSIPGVIGADEYAEGITDNAFTNGSAIKALHCAVKAAKEVDEKAPSEWADIADKIRIIHGQDGITQEYEGYKGQQIKQADENLLAYPLGIITDRDQIRRDLEYYDAKIDHKNGPAMTYGIFCVQYARLGDARKAEETFRRCYRPNMRPPFGVFAETPSSHNPYFATGAGALLQAVINGFGGLDITDKGIVQCKSVLPASWESLTIKGVGPDHKTYRVVNEK